MAKLNEFEKTKTHERYPAEGPLKSIKVSLAGYWARFEKSPDDRVVLRGKGEMLNSRAFNVSIPNAIYQKIYKRALCEFKPPVEKKPVVAQFVNPQPVPVPVFAPRPVQGSLF